LGFVLLVSLTQCKAPALEETKQTKSAAGTTLPAAAEIASPAAPDSGESNLSAGPDGRVYLTWIESSKETSALKFSVLGDNQTWSAASTVAEGKNWFVNTADIPSMIALPDGTLAAHWLADAKPGTEAYNVRLSLSHDGGKTWSKPVIPHKDRSDNEHGFVSLVATGRSELGVLWLDGNKIKDEEGDMSLMYTTIRADGKPGKETLLDGRVCECCQTSAAITPDGVVAVYRDRTDKEIRDISIARFTKDGWSQPEVLSKDNWQINGCPVNGPSVSTSGTNAAVAWFTAPGDVSQVNVVLSKDGGKTFSSPVRVDSGKPVGRVEVIAQSSGAALVSWLEFVDQKAQVRIRQVHPDLSLSDPLIVSGPVKVKFAAVPRMTMSANHVVFAWVDGDEPAKLRTAMINLN